MYVLFFLTKNWPTNGFSGIFNNCFLKKVPESEIPVYMHVYILNSYQQVSYRSN